MSERQSIQPESIDARCRPVIESRTFNAWQTDDGVAGATRGSKSQNLLDFHH
jgi:hypothetical protein